jgi:hypothetical protein
MMKIDKDETAIIGQWVFDSKRVTADEEEKRIEWLRCNYLIRIANDSSGWIILYQDPEDQRYWELNYPHGEMQGGGPHTLTLLSEDEAKDKYSF